MRNKVKVVIKFYIGNSLVRTQTETRSVYMLYNKPHINYSGKKFPIEIKDGVNYVFARYKEEKGRLVKL